MSPQMSVRAMAPGTVANVSSGFDVLAFALERPGDTVEARRVDAPGVHLSAVTGDDGTLPQEAARNTAGIAVLELLRHAGMPPDLQPGIDLTLEKGLPLNSGMGSSAASAVAGAVAVNALLETGLALPVLLQCAMAAEAAAVGFGHADNAGASLYGGMILVRGSDPPRVDRIPVAKGLTAAVVRPHWKINTGEARSAVPKSVSLDKAVIQAGNLGGLVLGLTQGDHELIASSLIDVLAEPYRLDAVPRSRDMREAALGAGALGAGLSGSGPSLYALCPDPSIAKNVMEAMMEAYGRDQADGYVSSLDAPGARLETTP